VRDDRVTLKLEGTVPLDLFVTAMSGFSGLIAALTSEVTSGAKVEWVVEELDGGSAFVALAGQSDTPQAVQEVVRAYERVGVALQKHEPFPYSEPVRHEVDRIASVTNGKVTGILMQDHAVAGHVELVAEEPAKGKTVVTFGAVEGVIQTLSSRNALRFTLYDALNDRAVYCYLNPTQHDMMRDFWDQRAIVQGLVTRDRQTGRPIEIRHISKVELVGGGDYRRARGILKGFVKTKELPEVTIRRNRDAE